MEIGEKVAAIILVLTIMTACIITGTTKLPKPAKELTVEDFKEKFHCKNIGSLQTNTKVQDQKIFICDQNLILIFTDINNNDSTQETN